MLKKGRLKRVFLNMGQKVLSEKFKKENSFFLKGKSRQKLVFNEKCKKCVCDCKQSWHVSVVCCPYYKATQKGSCKNGKK